MAQAYASALKTLGAEFVVIGRSTTSAAAFLNATGVPVITGGLEAAIAKFSAPERAIAAVGVEQLASVAQQLIKGGCRQLLLEKPGALCQAELQGIQTAAQACKTSVWIAYNRRFYASVQKLRQLVIDDGGITSAVFEFTEWSHRISSLQKAPGVKEQWLLANSSHVLDLAFNTIGLPAEGQWCSYHTGTLSWHPIAGRFHGAGISERGIPFTYCADWEAPGRWGLELLTRDNRYILRPLETLQAIPLGSIETKPITLNDELDCRFKPGLYLQCQAFLGGQTKDLCSLDQQLKAFPIYARIAGYPQ